MSKIVWLASFPKSGNTWVRVFLNNYVANGNDPVSINKLDEGAHACSRVLFDRLIGVPSSDLLQEEVDRYRPWMYIQWAGESTEPLFVKVHEAWRENGNGRSLFPAEATLAVLCIVRNPLDVVPSLSNHYGKPIDECIEWLNNPEYTLAKGNGRLSRQFPQLVKNWSQHSQSWLDESPLPVQVVRFEDMLLHPSDTFCSIVTTAGLSPDSARLHKAIQFSSFDQLKSQEQAGGFNERLPQAATFFNNGRSGSWRDVLSASQVQQIIDNHHPTMQRFGYLDEKD
ncbi:MAG: sulfotransferase domain-containing protein [Chloroflexi bacterium]|nr:sulfotransferase domain-containing protein [Chloroflexota bacterium]